MVAVVLSGDFFVDNSIEDNALSIVDFRFVGAAMLDANTRQRITAKIVKMIKKTLHMILNERWLQWCHRATNELVQIYMYRLTMDMLNT
jgi:hypothetical protein